MWYLLLISISLLGFWPIHYFFQVDLNKPLIFSACFLGSFLVVWGMSYFVNRKEFFRFPKFIVLLLFFIKESVKSNLWIAYDIITPGLSINPAIIAVPLDIRGDLEIVTLASMITLTPGTLSLEISPDQKKLYIHEMYIKGKDIESSKMNIKKGFEKKLIDLTK
jgi:multicomponent Na+:H+ antiporter subunit E